jgi:hypothetical protein
MKLCYFTFKKKGAVRLACQKACASRYCMLDKRPRQCLSSIIRIVVCICIICEYDCSRCRATESKQRTSRLQMAWPLHVIDNSSRGADGVRLADVNGDGLMDITTGWEQGAITRAYLHPGFDNVRRQWPAVTVGKTPSVEDAVFVDLDNDGGVDVISSCEGSTKKLFVHWAPDKSDYLNPVRWETEVFPACDGLTRWMFAAATQVDGKHDVDIIAGGKGDDAQIGWLEAPANPRAVCDYCWHSMSPVGWVMSIILSDMDGDGDLDVAISDRFGSLRGCRWLENPGPGRAQCQQWKNHLIGATGMEAMFMEIADLDDDKLDDIVVAVKPKSVLYLRCLDATGLSWRQYEIALPDGSGTAKAVAVGDIDKDGRKDIVFTCENARGKYGVGWLSYETAVTDSKWIHHDISGDKRGIKYDRIELLDLDNDGDLDVLTCEESQDGAGLGVIWYKNPRL